MHDNAESMYYLNSRNIHVPSPRFTTHRSVHLTGKSLPFLQQRMLVAVFPVLARKPNLPLLDFGRPPFNPFPTTTHQNRNANAFHALGALQKFTPAHSPRVGSPAGLELQHRDEEFGNAFRLLHAKMIFLA